MIAKNIYIAAGHSVQEPGARYKELKEEELTAEVAQATIRNFRIPDFKMTPVPVGLSLTQRIAFINADARKLDDGLAVEIHFNSKEGGRGAEVYYFDGSIPSRQLAEKLLTGYCVITGLPSRGAKPDTATRHGRLGFIRDVNCWSLLIECAFLQGDYEYLRQSSNIDKMAEGIVEGIRRIYGITQVVEVKPPQPQTDPKAPIKKAMRDNLNQFYETQSAFVDQL